MIKQTQIITQLYRKLLQMTQFPHISLFYMIIHALSYDSVLTSQFSGNCCDSSADQTHGGYFPRQQKT